MKLYLIYFRINEMALRAPLITYCVRWRAAIMDFFQIQIYQKKCGN